MTEQPPYQRKTRSFVRREGRLTRAQARALDELWPAWGVEHDDRLLNFIELFGNPNPVHVEIGFGNGDALLYAAERSPGENFLGIEVHRPGVGHLLLGVEQAQLKNVRCSCHDAVEVLEQQIPDHSLGSVRIYFPDPWHKKRHHKRRLVQSDFVALLGRKIRSGGFIHLATDWQAYAEQMVEVMEASGQFSNRFGAGHYCERPAWRPQTKFERRGLRLGHGVWDLIYQRN